jgi:hypothetical protein
MRRTLVLLAFHTANDVADNSEGARRACDAALLRAAQRRARARRQLPRASEFLRRQTLAWKIAAAASSPVAPLAARQRVPRAPQAGCAQGAEQAKAAASGRRARDLERRLLDPPPREWETLGRSPMRSWGDSPERSRATAPSLFVAVLSNGIQVDPDRGERRAFAQASAFPTSTIPTGASRRFSSAVASRTSSWPRACGRRRNAAAACLHGFANAEPCGGHWNAAGHRAGGKLIADALCQQFAAARTH